MIITGTHSNNPTYSSQDIAGYKGKIPVAVKTLSSQDPAVVEKFMEEAELMKRFTHPNIVSLLGQLTWLVMHARNPNMLLLEVQVMETVVASLPGYFL